MRLLSLLLALPAAAAQERSLALLPVEAKPPALTEADARDLDARIRAVAGEVLAPQGWTLLAPAAAPRDPGGALAATRAAAVVIPRTASMEGALVVTLVLHRPDAPARTARIAGVGLGAVREDVRGKVTKLLAGLDAKAAEETGPAPGTLRIPTRQPAAPKPPPVRAPPPGADAGTPGARLDAKPEAPRLPLEPPTSDPTVRLVREIVGELEQLRGLRRKENLKVQLLDDALFREALHTRAAQELTRAAVATERARWAAFALAPPSVDPAAVLLDVLDEQTAGFYDPVAKALFVRSKPPDSVGAGGPEMVRLVLAHEIEHALQDQNFGFPDLKALDDDARLARLAVYEGDAMLAMTALGAKRAGKPVRGAVVAAAEAMRALDVDTLLRLSGHSPNLAKAPAIAREELVLPYSAGLALVTDAWQRGGFALVDRIFRHPPRSTHELLHPEAYYAGEAQAPFVPPPAPAGTRALTTGRMGEAGTRVVLGTCVDKDVARDLVTGLRGDSYTIALGAGRALSLVWTTEWSRGAGEVANAMRMQAPCWEEHAAATVPAGGFTVAPEARVRVDGNRVVVVRGLSGAAESSAFAAALATKSVPGVAAPPLGIVPEAKRRETASVEGSAFRSPWLALEGELPEGYAANVAQADAELVLTRRGAGSGTLRYLPENVASDTRDQFFQSAAAGLRAALGGEGRLSFSGKRALAVGGVEAEERSWTLEGRGIRIHIALRPFCEGRAALAWLSIENAEPARLALDRFAGSLKPQGKPLACDELE